MILKTKRRDYFGMKNENGILKSKVSDVKFGGAFSNKSLTKFDKNKKTDYLPKIKLPDNIAKYRDIQNILRGVDNVFGQHKNTYKFIYNICHPSFFKNDKPDTYQINFIIGRL
jgi:hypothetical protein